MFENGGAARVGRFPIFGRTGVLSLSEEFLEVFGDLFCRWMERQNAEDLIELFEQMQRSVSLFFAHFFFIAQSVDFADEVEEGGQGR